MPPVKDAILQELNMQVPDEFIPEIEAGLNRAMKIAMEGAID
jgi:hypothetical protein